jgi:membrane associated rhomboid family serine protease
LIITIMGFVFRGAGIDNAAHLGGFMGGYLASLVLDPLKPERIDHIAAAVVCLVVTFAAIVYTVISAIPYIR